MLGKKLNLVFWVISRNTGQKQQLCDKLRSWEKRWKIHSEIATHIKEAIQMWTFFRNSRRGERMKTKFGHPFYYLFSCSKLFPLAIQFIYALFFTVNKNLNFGERQEIQTNDNNKKRKNPQKQFTMSTAYYVKMNK